MQVKQSSESIGKKKKKKSFGLRRSKCGAFIKQSKKKKKLVFQHEEICEIKSKTLLLIASQRQYVGQVCQPLCDKAITKKKKKPNLKSKFTGARGLLHTSIKEVTRNSGGKGGRRRREQGPLKSLQQAGENGGG